MGWPFIIMIGTLQCKIASSQLSCASPLFRKRPVLQRTSYDRGMGRTIVNIIVSTRSALIAFGGFNALINGLIAEPVFHVANGLGGLGFHRVNRQIDKGPHFGGHIAAGGENGGDRNRRLGPIGQDVFQPPAFHQRLGVKPRQ